MVSKKSRRGIVENVLNHLRMKKRKKEKVFPSYKSYTLRARAASILKRGFLNSISKGLSTTVPLSWVFNRFVRTEARIFMARITLIYAAEDVPVLYNVTRYQ